jgi:HlyD family secretion protein
VKQGDWVEKGQIMAYLDSYDQQLAQRDLAASQLQEAQSRLGAQTEVQEAQIQEAQTRLHQIDQPQSLGIEAQAARIKQLEASLALAVQDLKRNQQLRREGAISQQDLDRQNTTVQELQAQLKTAQATLIQLKSSRHNDLKNAKAQVKTAEANLPLSQVLVAIQSAEANLKLAEARLKDAVLKAPQDGRVLRIITHQGEAIPSAPTGGDEGVLELGNTRQMMAVAEVYESDISRVKVGQKSTIRSRNGAFTGTLNGTVREIGWKIFKNNVLDDDPAANSDARVVEVKIALEGSDTVASLTNLQVDVQIATD